MKLKVIGVGGAALDTELPGDMDVGTGTVPSPPLPLPTHTHTPAPRPTDSMLNVPDSILLHIYEVVGAV